MGCKAKLVAILSDRWLMQAVVARVDAIGVNVVVVDGEIEGAADVVRALSAPEGARGVIAIGDASVARAMELLCAGAMANLDGEATVAELEQGAERTRTSRTRTLIPGCDPGEGDPPLLCRDPRRTQRSSSTAACGWRSRAGVWSRTSLVISGSTRKCCVSVCGSSRVTRGWRPNL